MSENNKEYSQIYIERFKKSAIGRLINDKLIVNAGFIIGNYVVNAIGGVLFWYLAARLYASDQMGVAASLFSAIQLLSGFAALGFGIGLVRFLPRTKKPNQLVSSVIIISTLVSIIVSGLYLIFVQSSSSLSVIFKGMPGNQIGFILIVISFTVFSLLVQSFIGFRKSAFSFIQFLVMNILRLILLLFFVKFNGLGILLAIFIGLAAADWISISFFLPRAYKSFRFVLSWDLEKVKNMFTFSFGNYIGIFLFLLPVRLGPLFVFEMLGAQASAKVYIAWMFGMFVFSPGEAMARSTLAEVSYEPDEIKNTFLRALKYSFGITIPVTIIVFFSAGIIMRLFGVDYVEGSVGLLRWLVIAAPFASLNILYFTLLRVRKDVGEVIILSVVIAGISIVWPLWVIIQEGITAIGQGWFFANGIVSLYVCLRIFYGDVRRVKVHSIG